MAFGDTFVEIAIILAMATALSASSASGCVNLC